MQDYSKNMKLLMPSTSMAIIHVRTRFDLNPEQVRIQAHEARTINL